VPIFEYDCESCGARFDVLVRSGDDEPPSCAECGAKKCHKIFSTFATTGRARGGSAGPGAGGSNCGSCSRSSCAGCR
jgi:putative FmdB family regulatory protein